MSATPDRYFEERWEDSDDPWDQVERFSEQRKYDLTVASLPRPRYRRAYEPGCAIGSLTRRLAGRVDHLLASDRHERAVAAARTACAGRPSVVVELHRLPDDWPDGRFDLVVLSEILYYFDPPTATRILGAARASLEAGGHLVACHFRPEVPEHAVRGDEVHELIRALGWRPVVAHREPGFLLEVFEDGATEAP